VNKIDLPEVRERIPQMKADFTATHIAVSFISAVSGEGVRELMKTTADLLKKTLKEVKPPAIEDLKVFRPQPKKPRVKMNKKGTVFIIEASDIERVVARVDLDDATVMRQLRALLVRKGIVRELEKMGIKPGDKVRCGPAEWEW
jgi:GTP-binding protein